MMNSSCLRCGKCCTSFGVCITPFDVKRIARATGKEPEEFIDLVPEPPVRERKEPAILIDGERSLLVLKRDAFNVCFFYSVDRCLAYECRPMLCRTYPFRQVKRIAEFPGGNSQYPFRVSSSESCLVEMKSRACPEKWLPRYDKGRKYLRDCKMYEKEVDAYRNIADKWNEGGGGSLKKFVEFAFQ
jgi:Fe-S-cluster containining protein